MQSERARYTRTPASWIAGCSDTGQRHSSNQDAFCIAVRDGDVRSAIIAVADGVSTAHGSELASLVASETVVGTLVGLLGQGVAEDLAFVQAFSQAHQAVIDARVDDEPSACTLIAAHLFDTAIAVANVGDSRAYWIGDDGTSSLLSTDDSMAQARIMLGMSRDDAEQGKHAHAITKWLGKAALDVTPTLTMHHPADSGWLLLCTDGLWNYASAPEAMAPLVREFIAANETPSAIVEGLVDWANAQGGKDNITATIARVES